MVFLNKKRKFKRSKKPYGSALILLLFVVSLSAQTLDSLQRRFVEQRFGMFLHFNMNTYVSGWGNARTNPLNFNPANLDCAQWASAAKSAKMKWAVLTAKHHDGFTIWPSKQIPPNGQSIYTIAQSSTPTKDVVKDYVTAFRAAGIWPGLYMSIWDVANGIPRGTTKWTAAQRTFILGQITELLGGTYGDIPIFWFDGYSAVTGKWGVPWQEIRDTIKALQPNCVIVETNGMTEAWETDILFVEEPVGLWLPKGNTYAACQAQTIAGGWFWDNTATDVAKLKPVSYIVNDHINALNPEYCSFLLDCPPNKAGKLDSAIVTRLAEVGAAWNPGPQPVLPKQLPMIEKPITPVSATATSNSATAFYAIDDVNNQSKTSNGAYQNLWTSSGSMPQSVTLDLGKSYSNITMLFYLPKRDSLITPISPNGYITSYKIYTSLDGSAFTQIASGTSIDGGSFGAWAANSKIKRVSFLPQTARYVKLEALAVSGGANAIIQEVAVGTGPKATMVKTPASAISANQSSGKTILCASGRVDLGHAFSNRAVSIGVYDLCGKLVCIKQINRSNFDLQKDFNVPRGVYFIKVQEAGK